MKASFDEMNTAGGVRAHYRAYRTWLDEQQGASMQARREEAEMVFRRVGITFAVYGTKDEDGSGTERLIPFDVIPRIIPKSEWQRLEAPYDAARVRFLIGCAYRDLGDQESAAMELDAARWVFQQLGALPDLARVDALVAHPDAQAPGGLTLRAELLKLAIAAPHRIHLDGSTARFPAQRK